MTLHDRPEFARALHVLAEAFREPCSDIRAEGYFAALDDLMLSDVQTAVRIALRTCAFFPRPAELRTFVTGDPDALADAAWSAVIGEVRRVGYLGSPQFTDARVLQAVRDVWGSWQHLCETLPAEGAELVGWIKQFKGAYRSGVRRTEQAQLTAGVPKEITARLAMIAASKGMS